MNKCIVNVSLCNYVLLCSNTLYLTWQVQWKSVGPCSFLQSACSLLQLLLVHGVTPFSQRLPTCQRSFTSGEAEAHSPDTTRATLCLRCVFNGCSWYLYAITFPQLSRCHMCCTISPNWSITCLRLCILIQCWILLYVISPLSLIFSVEYISDCISFGQSLRNKNLWN